MSSVPSTQAKLPAVKKAGEGAVTIQSSDYVTMYLAGQLFGIPVLQVQDVIQDARITRIPLAPLEVAGSLNLRGRIVTSIDLRTRLALSTRDDGKKPMHIVVDYRGELYSLLVDAVGEVLALPQDRFEPPPMTLDARWREVASGIYRLDNQLLVVLDIQRLLDFANSEAA